MKKSDTVWVVDDSGAAVQKLLSAHVREDSATPFFETQGEANADAITRFTAQAAAFTAEADAAQEKVAVLLAREHELEA